MGELRSTQDLKTLHDYVVLITTANFSLHMLQGNSTRILTLQSAVGRLALNFYAISFVDIIMVNISIH